MKISLRELLTRLRRGETYNAVAVRASMAASVLFYIEKGKTVPRIETIIKILSVHGSSLLIATPDETFSLSLDDDDKIVADSSEERRVSPFTAEVLRVFSSLSPEHRKHILEIARGLGEKTPKKKRAIA